MTLYEADRVRYLQTLGITNYMPRYSLTNAPAAEVNQWLHSDVTVSAPEDEKERPSHLPQAKQTASRSAELLEQAFTESGKRPGVTDDSSQTFSGATETTQGPIKTTGLTQLKEAGGLGKLTENLTAPKASIKKLDKPAATTTASASATPSFSLSFWRITAELMIVDSRQGELALPVEKLLKNILLALGHVGELPKADIWQWPLIQAHHQDQSADAAKETLHAYLDTAFVLNPGKHLICMGKTAYNYLPGAPASYEQQLGNAFVIDDFSLEAIVVPSLADMLQEPLQKRITWQSLRYIKQKL